MSASHVAQYSYAQVVAQRDRLVIYVAALLHLPDAQHDHYLNTNEAVLVNQELDRMEQDRFDYNRDSILAEQELDDFEAQQFGE